jgi:hypothetical protein
MTPAQAMFLQQMADKLLEELMFRTAIVFTDDMDTVLCATLVAESVASAAQTLARQENCPPAQIAEMVRFGHATGKDVAKLFELKMQKEIEEARAIPNVPAGDA